MEEVQQNNNSISGYSESDIVTVLKRAFEETQENRNKALTVYDQITEEMGKSQGNLAILGTFAQNYLDTATKQTSELIKLATVMQRLKATDVIKDNPDTLDKSTVFQQVIQHLENKIIPLENVQEKNMNYKDKNELKNIQYTITEEKVITKPNDSDILQNKNNLKGLADLNLDELEEE